MMSFQTQQTNVQLKPAEIHQHAPLVFDITLSIIKRRHVAGFTIALSKKPNTTLSNTAPKRACCIRLCIFWLHAICHGRSHQTSSTLLPDRRSLQPHPGGPMQEQPLAPAPTAPAGDGGQIDSRSKMMF